MIMMMIMMLFCYCYCYCVIVAWRGLVGDNDHNDGDDDDVKNGDDDVIVLDQPFGICFNTLDSDQKMLTQELKSRLGLTQILQSPALKPPHSRFEHHRKPPLPLLVQFTFQFSRACAWM